MKSRSAGIQEREATTAKIKTQSGIIRTRLKYVHLYSMWLD